MWAEPLAPASRRRVTATSVPLSGNHHAVAVARRPSDRRDAMLRPRRLLVMEARGHAPRWYGAKNCLLLDARHTRRQRERDADDLRTLRLLSKTCRDACGAASADT